MRDPPSVGCLVTPGGVKRIAAPHFPRNNISTRNTRSSAGSGVDVRPGIREVENSAALHIRALESEAGEVWRAREANGEIEGCGEIRRAWLGVRGRLGSRGRGNGRQLAEGQKDRIYNDARNIINRKKRTFSVDEQEQMRRLGDSYSRCRGNHGVWDCPYKQEELSSSYPHCFDKQGHSIGACHDIMKRCRLEICQDQRGHRATCHSFMPDRKPYGFGADAVEALKRAYKDHRYLLTESEKNKIDQYE